MQGESTAASAAVVAGRMPGIVEVTTLATLGSSLKTPSTPRIDISRASSSSHHEDSNSRDSSPERELLAGDYFFVNYCAIALFPFQIFYTLLILYQLHYVNLNNMIFTQL